MKFDVEIPSLNGLARVEIRTVKEEEDRWAAYLCFVTDRPLADTCLLLGERGIPYRFTAPSEGEAEERAKAFLKEKYTIARMIW